MITAADDTILIRELLSALKTASDHFHSALAYCEYGDPPNEKSMLEEMDEMRDLIIKAERRLEGST